ncbi:MAG: hypothetical protein [Circular genetic element sp.]|nr:MAG: hypothetical protein [Circular genetic element sp.]
MSKFTKRELEIMVSALALDKGLDFLTGGKLNKYSRKAAIKIVKTTLPIALRATTSVGGSAARAALPLVTNPYLAGAALGYGALQTEPGQQLLEMAEDRGRMDRIRYEQALTDLEVGIKSKVKKTKSKFNKMVGAGMKKLKDTTSYGKKGVINAPKKAFKVVVSAASAVNRGKKLPKSGIKRTLMLMMRKI